MFNRDGDFPSAPNGNLAGGAIRIGSTHGPREKTGTKSLATSRSGRGTGFFDPAAHPTPIQPQARKNGGMTIAAGLVAYDDLWDHGHAGTCVENSNQGDYYRRVRPVKSAPNPRQTRNTGKGKPCSRAPFWKLRL